MSEHGGEGEYEESSRDWGKGKEERREREEEGRGERTREKESCVLGGLPVSQHSPSLPLNPGPTPALTLPFLVCVCSR